MSPGSHVSRDRWPTVVAIILTYLLIGLVWTWPLVLHWRTGVIQNVDIPVDAGQNLWNLWWSRWSLGEGINPFKTRYLLFPEQIDLFQQTLGLPNAILVWPLLVTRGPIAAFNAIVWLSFGLGGYWAYRLARQVTRDRVAAFIAGCCFVLAPFHFQPIYSGSLEVAAIHWIALYLLLLHGMLRHPTPGRVVAVAGALTVTTLSSHYYGLYGALYTAGAVLLALLLTRERRVRLTILAAGAAVALMWVLALVPLVGSFGELETQALRDWYVRQTFLAPELGNFLVPNEFHPLWGNAATQLLSRVDPYGPAGGAAAGVVIYALVVFALWREPRRAWPWLLLAVATAIIALGPELMVGGQPSGIPLPYRLLDLLAPFRTASRTNRMLAITMLLLAIAASIGVAAIRRITQWKRMVSALVLLALAAELAVRPWPIITPTVAPIYTALNDDPQPGAVLELPPLNDDSRYMVNQLCHGRPLVGGYLAHTPRYPQLEHASALQQLWNAQTRSDIFAFSAGPELATLGVRAVVVNHASYAQEQLDQITSTLDVPGIVRASVDQERSLYLVDPAAADMIVLPGAGWYAPETDSQRRWRWMSGSAVLRLILPKRAAVSLTMRGFAYGSTRPLSVRVDGQELLSTTMPSGRDAGVTLRLVLPGGEHEVRLDSVAAADSAQRQISLAFTRVEIDGTFLDGGEPSEPVAPPTVAQQDTPPCGGSELRTRPQDAALPAGASGGD